jgi:hypothetical protein
MTVNQAGDSVSFRSAERGRYAEGYTSEVSIGGNIGSIMTGDQLVTFGMYDVTMVMVCTSRLKGRNG